MKLLAPMVIRAHRLHRGAAPLARGDGLEDSRAPAAPARCRGDLDPVPLLAPLLDDHGELSVDATDVLGHLDPVDDLLTQHDDEDIATMAAAQASAQCQPAGPSRYSHA